MVVAIAYHLQKTPYVFPVLGGRKVENLLKNIEALTISLSKEQMAYLESALPFDLGFPHWMVVSTLLLFPGSRRLIYCVLGQWYRTYWNDCQHMSSRQVACPGTNQACQLVMNFEKPLLLVVLLDFERIKS